MEAYVHTTQDSLEFIHALDGCGIVRGIGFAEQRHEGAHEHSSQSGVLWFASSMLCYVTIRA
jgi:hypothetical protein